MNTATSIKDWINKLQQNGKLYFSIEQVSEAFSGIQPTGIRSALARLSAKNSIVSVWKGFYVIVPKSYTIKGILPPVMYIDHLMQHIKRPYYVGLLNAAAFYGAALQQPGSTSVVQRHGIPDTVSPSLCPLDSCIICLSSAKILMMPMCITSSTHWRNASSKIARHKSYSLLRWCSTISAIRRRFRYWRN